MNIPPAPPGVTPAVQVVGFFVDGATPSPEQDSLLSDAVPVGASSPTPVIIPPSFHSAMQTLPTPPTSGALVKPTAGAQTSSDESSDGDEPAAQSRGSPSRQAASGLALQGTRPVAAPEVAPEPSGGKGGPSPASTSAAAGQAGASGAAAALKAPGAPSEAAAAAAAAAGPAAPPPQAPAAASQGPAAAAGKAPPRGGPPPSEPKAQLSRAERRAIQEAQRAAKAAAKDGATAQAPKPAKPAGAAQGGGAAGSGDAAAKVSGKAAGPAAAASAGSAAPAAASPSQAPLPRSESSRDRSTKSGGGAAAEPAAPAAKKPAPRAVMSVASTDLFTHLPQYQKATMASMLARPDVKQLHPAVLKLGLLYANGAITGANARCMAMLHAFCQVIADYSTPPGKSLSRDLTQQLSNIINFLVECRPLSVSMGNAIKHVKLVISKVDPSKPEQEAKDSLISEISDFINGRIYVADQMITKQAAAKVDQGDVILTFGYSHVVASSLLEAASGGKRFRVMVVDARPENEGKAMVTKLIQAGISCSFVPLTAVCYAIREVSKVLLGAAAVMSNGTVMSRAGSASVAMVAHAFSKPVMICCESYKFHERVQLDSITHNELGDPDALAKVAGRPDVQALSQWREQPRLGLLNLKYDAMPADYVTMIVTEFGMIPPTSVPVILREYSLARQEQA